MKGTNILSHIFTKTKRGVTIVPVPPIDKQKEIADYKTLIRQQAQQFKVKSKDFLKKASEEIEIILLH